MNRKIFVPPASGLKFVPVNYHANCGNLPQQLSPFVRNTDNTLLRDEILANRNQGINYNIGINYYREAAFPYLSCTPLTIQLKSDFVPASEHNIKIYQNCDLETVLDTISMPLKLNNREYSVYYDCKLAGDGAGGTYVFFTTGRIQKPLNFNIGNFYLNGNLPEFAAEIDEIKIINAGSNNGTFDVLETVYVSELNAFAFRIDHAFAGIDMTGRALMTYKRDSFNVYQSELDLSDYKDLNIRLKIEARYFDVHGIFKGAEIWSEPIMVRDKLPGLSKVEWTHSDDKFFVDFSDRVKFAAFLPVRLFEIEADEIEDEQITTDTGKIFPINTVYSERYGLKGWMMPRWMVRLIDLVLKFDEVYINATRYQKIGSLASEKEIEKGDRFNIECTMNKVEVNGVYDTDYDFNNQTLPENQTIYVDETGDDYTDEHGSVYTDGEN